MSRSKRHWASSAAVLMLLGEGAAMVHKHLTFDPPFVEFDHFGKRSISSDWDMGGETKILKNFVRLTPDQQSKTGALWSVDEIGNDVFAAVVEFRISGKGERFFGDGLAFWVVTPEHRHSLHDPLDHYYYGDDWGGAWDLKTLRADLPSGDFHGFVETFKGVGVIVDTYRNEEFYSSHKDVTVVVNTGNMTKTEILHASAGCNAQVRYYEKRDDFDASSQSSRLKVEVSGKTLTVKIDAKNTQKWVDCAQIQIPEEMDDKWASGGHIGITASTGELSDNHDVIRLATYVDSEAAVRGEEARERKQPMEVEPSLPFLERMTMLEKEVNNLLSAMKDGEHEQEHNLNRLQDYVEQLIEKTTTNEKGLKENLELLESRLKDMEDDMKQHFQALLKEGMLAAEAFARGWRVPFLVLVVGLVVAGVFIYRSYRGLRKSHLL